MHILQSVEYMETERNMMKKILVFVYFFLAVTLMTLRNAQAYIDPSSMTYLIQIIAGAAVAVGAGLGFYWKRIKRYFRNKKRAKEEARYAAEYAAEAEDSADQQ